jgi:methanogenic corrinoid protein MtbC1
MIKWCSYCIRFIGEVAPYEDFLITHGVCQACAPKVLSFGPSDKRDSQALRTFFQSLQETARTGTRNEVARILEKRRRLDLSTLDLMMGMLQPLLTEIGALWAVGKVTVSTEHRFSALAGDLLAQARLEAGLEARSGPPSLLLITAEDNYHTLGLQMAEIYFAAHGLTTLTVTPGLPPGEVLDLVAFHQPQAVGFSLAQAHGMNQILALAKRLHALPMPPRHVLVGGAAARRGLDPATGVRICRDLAEVLPLFGLQGQHAKPHQPGGGSP